MQIIFLTTNITSEDLHHIEVDMHGEELQLYRDLFKEMGTVIELRTTNLGGGTDFPMFYALVQVAVDFLEKLAVGVTLYHGFPQLQKISFSLRKAVKHSSDVYLDIKAAKVLAIGQLTEMFDIKELKVIMQEVSRLSDLTGSFPDRAPGSFLAHPKSVYHFTFDVNAERFISMLVFWNGEVRVEFEIERSMFEI